jgi:hypothetical protein
MIKVRNTAEVKAKYAEFELARRKQKPDRISRRIIKIILL